MEGRGPGMQDLVHPAARALPEDVQGDVLPWGAFFSRPVPVHARPVVEEGRHRDLAAVQLLDFVVAALALRAKRWAIGGHAIRFYIEILLS